MTIHEVVACNTCETVLAVNIIPDGLQARHMVEEHGGDLNTSVFVGKIDTETAAAWVVAGVNSLLAEE
jgi:hypothetical protein